jgi:hypothetical protein
MSCTPVSLEYNLWSFFIVSTVLLNVCKQWFSTFGIVGDPPSIMKHKLAAHLVLKQHYMYYYYRFGDPPVEKHCF